MKNLAIMKEANAIILNLKTENAKLHESLEEIMKEAEGGGSKELRAIVHIAWFALKRAAMLTQSNIQKTNHVGDVNDMVKDMLEQKEK